MRRICKNLTLVVMLFAGIVGVVYAQFTELNINANVGVSGVNIVPTHVIDYDNDGNLDFEYYGTYRIGYQEYYVHRMCRNNGDGTFTSIDLGFSVATGYWPDLWADYDNDGDLDATTDFGLYRNNGNSTFTYISDPAFNNLTRVVVWADFDSDGDLDLLAASNSSQSYLICRNDGSDQFTTINTNMQALSLSTLQVADLNNDGKFDVVDIGYLTTESNKISNVYENLGDGDFLLHDDNLIGVRANSAMIGDYDSDGDMDIAYIGFSENLTRTTRLYRNDGDWIFSNIQAGFVNMYADGNRLSWGDYNNDGDLDLLMAGDTGIDNSSIVYLYENEGNETFTSVPSLNTINSYRVFGGDFDSDGDLDILCSGTSPGYVRILRNDVATPNQVPSPPTISINYSTGVLTFSSDDDDTTPVQGLTYDIRIGTTPGGADIRYPSANLLTGQRRKLEFGSREIQLKWPPTQSIFIAAQSVDNTYSGSVFGQEILISPLPLVSLQSDSDLEFGIADIGYTTTTQSVVIQNWGTAPLTISSLNFLEPVSSFSTLDVTPIVIGPGSNYTISVVFTPLVNGSITDSLFIHSDAFDQQVISMKLHGTGQYAPLSVVSDITIEPSYNSIDISWTPVTTNIYGTTQFPDGYVILSSRDPYADINDYSFVAYVPGTSFNHIGVHYFYKAMFYVIKAVIINRSEFQDVLSENPNSMKDRKWGEIRRLMK